MISEGDFNLENTERGKWLKDQRKLRAQKLKQDPDLELENMVEKHKDRYVGTGFFSL